MKTNFHLYLQMSDFDRAYQAQTAQIQASVSFYRKQIFIGFYINSDKLLSTNI